MPETGRGEAGGQEEGCGRRGGHGKTRMKIGGRETVGEDKWGLTGWGRLECGREAEWMRRPNC